VPSFRTGREFFVLLVDQRFEHLPDHAEMIAMPLELALEVDEIGGGGVEPLGEQAPERRRSPDAT
jgi:hypothetical protein